MCQVVETSPPLSSTLNETILKSEADYEQAMPVVTSVSSVETLVAPPSVNQAQLITVPIASTQPLLTSTSSATIKRKKRGYRTYFNSKKLHRLPLKLAPVLARPATVNASTTISNIQKPLLLSNPIAPVASKAGTSNNSSSGFTTYLVVDGNQGQLVQVSNDGQKPVTFRNQVGQILQATPITVLAPTNQPVISSIPSNTDCSMLSNTSQTITTVRTSSSIDLQQQTTLMNGTTTMTTQQLSGINLQPTTITNRNNWSSYESNSSFDEFKTSNSNLSLSLTQIAEKINHRHRRSSSSSISKKKRGRPRLYERDPLTNRPIKNDTPATTIEAAKPNLTTTTLLMPGQTTTFNTLTNHGNTSGTLVFPNQATAMSITNPSLLQQHQYSYPSLLNGTGPTNILTTPVVNTISNNITSSTAYPYVSQSQPIIKEYIQPLVSTTTSPSHVEVMPRIGINSSNSIPSTSSPIRQSSDGIAVHYIGGFVIRESNQPFVTNQNSNEKVIKDQLQCFVCQKVDFSNRFFDRENRFCSMLCSSKLNESKISVTSAPIQTSDNMSLTQHFDTSPTLKTPLPNDHDLPADPTNWTVSQVGQFIQRLTNETIRQVFFESEIDGQALLLITPEHLRDTMKIKLGPSLIISSEIDKLRERSKAFSS